MKVVATKINRRSHRYTRPSRLKPNRKTFSVTKKDMEGHNLPPIEWDNTYQVCTLIRDHINEALNKGRKLRLIAEDAKVATSTIAKLASGQTREPRASTVVNILQSFNYKITIQRQQH